MMPTEPFTGHPLRLRAAACAALATVALGAAPAGAAAPTQEEELTWNFVELEGGAVSDVDVAWNEDEDAEMRPGRTPQVIAATGLAVFTSEYGDAWEREGRPENVRNVLVSDGGRGLYVGGEESWRSTNGGSSFSRTRIRDDEPARMLAISPDWAVDRTVYAVTVNDGRLYKTEEGRSSWAETILDPEAELWIGGVAFSPVTSLDEVVFAAADQGIYKSSNNGQTWTLVSDDSAPAFGPDAGSVWHQGLVTSPDYGDDPDRIRDPEIPTLFAYNEGGVYRSNDDGATWSRLGLEVDRVTDLAVSPGWPRDRTLLAAVEDEDGSVAAVSEDGGVKWRFVAGHHGLKGTAVAMAPDYAPPFRGDPENGIFLPVALRNGPLENGDGNDPPEGSREAYLSTDGAGVWRTSDAGATWTPIQSGFHGVSITTMAMLPGGTDAPVLVGTAKTGLYRSPDGGATWEALETALPLGDAARIEDFAVSPDLEADETVLLAAASGLWRSGDGGATWERTHTVRSAAVDVSPAFGSDGVAAAPGLRSNDGGRSWFPETGTLGARAVAFSPDYPEDGTLWVGGANGLKVTRDDGDTWSDVDDSALRDRAILSLATLAVRSSPDPLRVFAGTSRGIIATHDGGDDWDRQSGTLSSEVYSVQAVNYLAPVGATVLGAGDGGAGYSLDRGVDWERDRDAPDPSFAGTLSDDACRFVVGGHFAVAWADVVLDPRCEG